MMPAMAKKKHVIVEERTKALTAWGESEAIDLGVNKIEYNDKKSALSQAELHISMPRKPSATRLLISSSAASIRCPRSCSATLPQSAKKSMSLKSSTHT